ncbi:MAG: plasmid pRiA4b ORF-3 family protein [Streptosporangiaceae bacterium]
MSGGVTAIPSAFALPELADAALSCEALARALRLARWVGPGRKLTGSGVLRPADAVQACHDLDIALPGPRLRSALDVDELMLDWVTAVAAGLLETDGRQAWAAPDLPEAGSAVTGQPETILRAWIQAATTLLNMGEEPCPGCLLVLHELDKADGPHTVEEIVAAIEAMSELGEPEADEPGLDEAEGTPCPGCGRVHEWSDLSYLDDFLDDGDEPDPVEHAEEVITGLLAFDAVDFGDGAVRLTALGELLAEAAFRWRAPSPQADMATLVSVVSVLPPTVALTVAQPWLGARSAADAGQGLLAFAESARGNERAGALALASQLGPDAWREWATRPGVGAYARQWLRSEGEAVAQDPADEEWLAADALSVMQDTLAGVMPPALSQAAVDSARSAMLAYQLKITLRGVSKPPVWRRVLVPAGITLGDLHDVIQIAMGWDNYHLHVFSVGLQEYGPPGNELGHANEDRVRLLQLLAGPGDRLRYTYDFGDDWEHDIVLEEARPLVPGEAYPSCVAGKGACPPEDCGGTWGYAELKEVLANPAHEDHLDRLEWLGLDTGEDFDPREFSAADVNPRL